MNLVETTAVEQNEDTALRAMFAARKEVFVDLLNWNVPVLANRFEIDHFDNPDARYLILLDDTGRHRASARLLPTTVPHILDSLFPELCEEELPRGEKVFEITRFCLDRHQSALERRAARNRLVSAIADFALANDIVTYTGVAELAWLKQILTFGWRCRPLGPPRHVDGQMLAALRIDIDHDTITHLMGTGIYDPNMQRSTRPFQKAA